MAGPGVTLTERLKLPTQPYLHMTSQELIKQYMPSFWTTRGLTPDGVIAAHVSSVVNGSERARNSLSFLLNISYGDTERQKLDMINLDCLPKGGPILIYIHGGYWQMLGRELSTFMSLPVYQAGGAVVAVGYDLAPEVTLLEITNQIKRAVAHVLVLAEKRGSRGVYLCGHSAGGHLAAMMLSVDWMTEFHISSSLIKGVALFSGVFDVRPLVKTPENDVLKLDNDTAWSCSPFRHVKDVNKHCKHSEILVAVGSDESPEFIRQSKEYYEVLNSRGLKCEYLEVEGEDHFTLVEKLQESDYILTQKLLSLMRINGGDGERIFPEGGLIESRRGHI